MRKTGKKYQLAELIGFELHSEVSAHQLSGKGLPIEVN
jgi:hypothetical protein